MHNFVFEHPTKIIFGKQTIPKIGSETAQYGTTVLLVFGGGSIYANGTFDEAYQALDGSGCRIVEYGGITPNPKLSEVHEGIEHFRRNSCDVICAIGGGSVIDAAKAISCGALVAHDVWKFFTGKKRLQSTVPLTCVSTIPGSGSESNSGMVITNEEKQQKFGYGNRLLYPKVAILDPLKTCSLSWELTAYGIIDTISHLVEYFCNNSLDQATVQERLIVSLIRSALDCADTLRENPDDYSARSQMMWIASLAMGGLVSSGLGRVNFPMHLIEHTLSGHYNTPHGAGLGVVLPGWMEYMASTEPEPIEKLGGYLFNFQDSSPIKTAARTAYQFKNLFRKLGCPVCLAEIGVDTDSLSALAASSLDLARIWRLQRDYPPETVEKILNLCI